MQKPYVRLAGLIAAAAALGGCDAENPAFADESRDAPVSELAEAPGPEPRLCAAIERQADDLISNAMTCATDVDCEVELGTVVSEEPCLPQLACWLPISTSERVELDVVLDRLQDLDAVYREACGTCPVPDCADPEVVYSTCEHQASCVLAVDPPPNELSLATPPATPPVTTQ